jgi:type I restriction enzyme R subunit
MEISTWFNTKRQAFRDFVLTHHVSQGVEELDQEKLTPLLRLKYQNAIADAVVDLGKEIREAVTGFQEYLCQGRHEGFASLRGRGLQRLLFYGNYIRP